MHYNQPNANPIPGSEMFPGRMENSRGGPYLRSDGLWQSTQGGIQGYQWEIQVYTPIKHQARVLDRAIPKRKQKFYLGIFPYWPISTTRLE